MFRLSTSVAAVAMFAVLFFADVYAQGADSPEGDTRDLKNFTCKEMMLLSGQDRDLALALAHGYVLGKKGTTQYSIEALGQITDKFLDHCLDNPKDNALASFEKIAM